jgi:hypothetical protein
MLSLMRSKWPTLLAYETQKPKRVAASPSPVWVIAKRPKSPRPRRNGTCPDTLAELYLELGERDKARLHALDGYKKYWADGPPYSFHWQLDTCRAVLQAPCEPEPQLPPSDPAKIQTVPLRSRIRRLLAEHAAKGE